jgi:hypothetical protein
VEHLPSKATSNKKSQPKGEVMWAEDSKAIEVGVPKPIGVHIMQTCVIYARHGATRFNFGPSGFQSFFGPISPFYAIIPPFSDGNINSIALQLLYFGSI